jgi:hypothetical protein
MQVVDNNGNVFGSNGLEVTGPDGKPKTTGGGGVTPAALTKVDDTNVTLTLGGSPSTALLQATSLTLGWTGTLADSRIASAATWNAKQNAITLTTTGTSGPATLVGSTLNIPQYGGGGGLQGVHVLYGNLPTNWGFNAAVNGIASTNVTPSASTLSVYPFSPNKTLINCALLVNVQAATVGVLGRVLIYSDLNGFADTKLYESTDLDLSTTGDKTVLANFTFNAGTTYWLGYYANGTATMRAINSTSLVPIGLTFAVSSPIVAWVRINTPLGTAPNPFTRNTQQSSAQVNIFIRPS